MKIRQVTPDTYPKVVALLRQSFPRSNYEVSLVEKLHKGKKGLYEWVCIHTNRVIGYIAFTHAYRENEVCGFHMGPLAVKPEFQNQGVGTELVRFALRQEKIKTSTIYTLGNPEMYKKYGFELCQSQVSLLATKKRHLLCLGDASSDSFTVGYEQEFGKG